MTNEKRTEERTSGTLGAHLAAIRDSRGLSLRQVEEATEKAVSNAYLSQIEKGKIQKPSPNILHALARTYNTSYEQLMLMAGYAPSKKAPPPSFSRAATFAAMELTEEEQDDMIAYIKWKRSLGAKS